MTKKHFKNGFTLMELMVYIAILGVIVLIAGRAFSDSTKFRLRTQNMLKSNEVAEAVASMFAEDVSQTGVKSFKQAGDATTPDAFGSSKLVFMDPDATQPDSSSFSLSKKNAGDSLTIRRVRLSSEGAFEAVEQVSWFKSGNAVYRSCRTLELQSGTAPAECPSEGLATVEIATDVDSFQVVAAKPSIVSDGSVSAAQKSVLLPKVAYGETELPFRLVSRYNASGAAMGGSVLQLFPLSVTPEEGGSVQKLSGFVSNYNSSLNAPDTDGKKSGQVFVAQANTGLSLSGGDDWKNLCSKVTLDSMAEYEISFKVLYSEDNSRLFCPGRDHASVGFRTLTGEAVVGLDDFMFYAPNTEFEPSLRSFRFGVKRPVKNVCLGFTFASYSPAAGGVVSISDLVLKKVESANYNFDNASYQPDISDKQNVKAFQLRLVVRENGESGEVLQVVPVPSNGPRD